MDTADQWRTASATTPAGQSTASATTAGWGTAAVSTASATTTTGWGTAAVSQLGARCEQAAKELVGVCLRCWLDGEEGQHSTIRCRKEPEVFHKKQDLFRAIRARRAMPNAVRWHYMCLFPLKPLHPGQCDLKASCAYSDIMGCAFLHALGEAEYVRRLEEEGLPVGFSGWSVSEQVSHLLEEREEIAPYALLRYFLLVYGWGKERRERGGR